MYRVIKSLERSFSFLKVFKNLQAVEKAGLAPGTKRTWGGRDYIKGSDRKWHNAPKHGEGVDAPEHIDNDGKPNKKPQGQAGAKTHEGNLIDDGVKIHPSVSQHVKDLRQKYKDAPTVIPKGGGSRSVLDYKNGDRYLVDHATGRIQQTAQGGQLPSERRKGVSLTDEF